MGALPFNEATGVPALLVEADGDGRPAAVLAATPALGGTTISTDRSARGLDESIFR